MYGRGRFGAPAHLAPIDQIHTGEQKDDPNCEWYYGFPFGNGKSQHGAVGHESGAGKKHYEDANDGQ